jgi:putative tryptophan/tyrosine transport system substrate-binding protein
MTVRCKGKRNVLALPLDLFIRRSFCCLLGTWMLSAAPCPAADIVAVKSNELLAYDQAIAGFREAFHGSVTVLLMKGPLSEGKKLASAVREEKPKAILAVGLRAVLALRSEISDIPIVFCVTPSPAQKVLQAENITGVDLEPSIGDQLRTFKEVFPKLRKLGVIYDAKQSAIYIEASKQVASELGIELVEHAILEQREVPGAIQETTNEIDGFWIIRDVTVVSREFLDQILILQLEKKLPVFAYTDQFVRKGVFCSFSSSYQQQGKKAAEMIQPILNGAKPKGSPLQTPEGLLNINLNTASKIGVKIPESVLQRPGLTPVGE